VKTPHLKHAAIEDIMCGLPAYDLLDQ